MAASTEPKNKAGAAKKGRKPSRKERDDFARRAAYAFKKEQDCLLSDVAEKYRSLKVVYDP